MKPVYWLRRKCAISTQIDHYIIISTVRMRVVYCRTAGNPRYMSRYLKPCLHGPQPEVDSNPDSGPRNAGGPGDPDRDLDRLRLIPEWVLEKWSCVIGAIEITIFHVWKRRSKRKTSIWESNTSYSTSWNFVGEVRTWNPVSWWKPLSISRRRTLLMCHNFWYRTILLSYPLQAMCQNWCLTYP